MVGIVRVFDRQYSARLSCNEYVLRIPMPWTSDYYAIQWDRIQRGRKYFAVIVSFSGYSGFHLRAWWGYSFATCQPGKIDDFSSISDK
jgi:hypothetical protein